MYLKLGLLLLELTEPSHRTNYWISCCKTKRKIERTLFSTVSPNFGRSVLGMEWPQQISIRTFRRGEKLGISWHFCRFQQYSVALSKSLASSDRSKSESQIVHRKKKTYCRALPDSFLSFLFPDSYTNLDHKGIFSEHYVIYINMPWTGFSVAENPQENNLIEIV